jgi:Ni/Fe-hydrogenase subunit HybB-like protein
MASTTQTAPETHTGVKLPVLEREKLILSGRSYHWITERICGVVENRQPFLWWLLFIPSALIALIGVGGGLTYLVSTGVGVWGMSNRVFWGFDITNFVFWIGIGHAGTLISAVLFLTRQNWRTSINRAAEAMTIFAVICAGIFPAFHVGRVWFAWFLAPVPNANAIWQNFKSPLLWDVFAVSTYFTISLIFWYLGMVPDLATIRDRCKPGIRKILYGIFSLGWRGGNRQWSNFEMAYLLLAGLSTPLVLSVHTIVSFDFAVSNVPGWHTTIFPPYFVAGAIFSGFAMVLTLMLPLRAIYRLHDVINQYHIDNMCKIILATGTMVGYAYATEFFIAAYSGNSFEKFAFVNRAFGQYAWAYWIMVSCNVITPQLFWFKKVRENHSLVWIICLFVNVGMWFERFVITITSLANDYLPSSWGYYSPTIVDIFTFFGTFGFFSVLFLLFVRFLPLLPMAEVKMVAPQADPHAH